MSDKEMVLRCRASDKAAKAKVQHVMLAITADGQVHINGSVNLIQGLADHPSLLEELKSNIITNKLDEGSEIIPTGSLAYPLLPCSPYTTKWPGSKEVRNILTRMLVRGGYSRNGKNKALGSGEAPPGWPEYVIPWASYKGACRSGLTSLQITNIIIQLLRGVNLDENTHIQQQGQNDEDTDYNEDDEDNIEVGEVAVGGMNEDAGGVNNETNIDNSDEEIPQQEHNYASNDNKDDEHNIELDESYEGGMNIENVGVDYENNNDNSSQNNIVYEVIEEPAAKKKYIGNN